MSQEKSKMPVSRQIRYLRGSRDNWKQNAAKKQQKIRQYEQTIRSLKISRDNWKTRAKEAEKRVKRLENHQQVIYTYDVTHGMANLLKKELEIAQDFQDFLADCHRCKQQLQQTELAFLAPPAQRSQCRYFNAERLVTWAIGLLNCPVKSCAQLLPSIDTSKLEQRLKEKLIWLHKYQEQIPLWAKMCQMTRTLEKQLKIFGLNRESQRQFSKTLSEMVIPQSLEPFKHKIFDYLQSEMALLDDNQTVLATSDVIESIFGKYKCFSQRCPLKDLRSMLLTIPLMTMDLTQDVIKKA